MRFGASWNTSAQRVLILIFLRKKILAMVAKLGNIANLCNLAHTRKRYTPKRNKRRCPVRRYRVGRLCKYDTMLLSFGFRIVAGRLRPPLPC